MTYFTKRWAPRAARGACLALALALSACGGSDSTPAAPPPATPPPVTPPTAPTAPATTLALSAASGSVAAGGRPVALTATVSDTSAISWQLAAGNPGTLSAATGASVNYLPPASGVGADTTVTITATANGVSKSVTLTLTPDPDPPRLALLAGDTGGEGVLDGVGVRARFSGITAGAFDNDGNLYLADPDSGYGHAAIRKVAPDGTVSTLLRTESAVVDGDRATARIRLPSSLAAGADGALYFVDGSNRAYTDGTVPVRKLDRSGAINTITSIALKAGEDVYLAGDRGGKLYAVQSERISLIGANGGLTPLAGAATGGGVAVDGPGATARFVRLSAAANDAAGNLYLIDGRAVRKVAPDGTVSTIAGVAAETGANANAIDGSGANAHFAAPYSIGVNAAGNILVSDRVQANDANRYLLRTVTPAGVVSSVPMADAYEGDALLVSPKGPVLRRTLYRQIDALAADGSGVPFAGNKGSFYLRQDGSGAAARFLAPNQMVADSGGSLYVTDLTSELSTTLHPSEPTGFYLRKITPDGTVGMLADLNNAGYPSGLAIDRNNTVYLSIRPSRFAMIGAPPGGGIYRLQPDGNVVLLAGAVSNNYSYVQVDGTGAAARFIHPTLEGADADGNLYVSDTGPATVRKVTPAGVVTSIAALPAGLKNVADQAGNLYTTDAVAHLVYKTTPAGVKTVVAGTAGERGTMDGPLPGHLLRPSLLVATGPYSFALLSDKAVMKLVVPR